MKNKKYINLIDQVVSTKNHDILLQLIVSQCETNFNNIPYTNKLVTKDISYH